MVIGEVCYNKDRCFCCIEEEKGVYLKINFFLIFVK